MQLADNSLTFHLVRQTDSALLRSNHFAEFIKDVRQILMPYDVRLAIGAVARLAPVMQPTTCILTAMATALIQPWNVMRLHWSVRVLWNSRVRRSVPTYVTA